MSVGQLAAVAERSKFNTLRRTKARACKKRTGLIRCTILLSPCDTTVLYRIDRGHMQILTAFETAAMPLPNRALQSCRDLNTLKIFAPDFRRALFRDERGQRA